LPATVEGRPVRHALEARHESFRHPEFVALLRAHKVAVVTAGDSEYPQIADITAPFVYARIMGTTEKAKLGYQPAALDAWVERAQAWAAGRVQQDLATVATAPKTPAPCDVFLYVISGFKEKNPAAAMALIERLG
jgi:uncharacterized protein YecE (DUF72 family)